MKCPKCGFENPDGAEDCRSCGIFFAKWRKMAEAKAAAGEPAPAAETAPPESTGRSRSVLGWLLPALLLLGGVGGVVYKSMEPKKTEDPRLLSPEPYREQILALEAALYKEEPANYQDAMAVEKAAGEMLEKYMTSRRLRRNDVMEKLSMLGSMAGGEQIAYSAMARREWITAWEDARGSLFEKAGWFHAPVFVNSEASAAADQNAVILSMQRSLSWADRLIAEGRAEIQAFGEKSVDLRTINSAPENKLNLEQWRLWVPGWQTRVNDAASSLPSPAVIASRELQDAHKSVSQVFGLLLDPPDPGAGAFLSPADPLYKARYLPDRRSRDGWLNTAENWLKYPREVVQKAAGGGGPAGK